MQPARRFKIGPVSKAILACVAVTGVVSIAMLFPGITYALTPFFKSKKHPRSQNIQRSLNTLIGTGLIKQVKQRNGSITLELTRKGKWEAMLHTSVLETKSRKWDKLWRVVVFDVPQTKSRMRRELRRVMRLYGFKILQQSVWVYPYPCDDFVHILKKYLGVSNDVLYMKVAFIENEKHLRKEFNLS
jgi:DNA-binding transcriptional regulator PaaX